MKFKYGNLVRIKHEFYEGVYFKIEGFKIEPKSETEVDIYYKIGGLNDYWHESMLESIHE